jgi:thymidylate synthase ThyX
MRVRYSKRLTAAGEFTPQVRRDITKIVRKKFPVQEKKLTDWATEREKFTLVYAPKTEESPQELEVQLLRCKVSSFSIHGPFFRIDSLTNQDARYTTKRIELLKVSDLDGDRATLENLDFMIEFILIKGCLFINPL